MQSAFGEGGAAARGCCGRIQWPLEYSEQSRLENTPVRTLHVIMAHRASGSLVMHVMDGRRGRRRVGR